ncbi:hypothetical protein [Ochrobactrum sp. MC-1LL]|uniref:Bbp19 family protein n=1 Tax=Ochrobactrum sp. MC-1LL TaxID=2735351 RepID=UPI001438304A|nr:hypothetical protein [Ochrobactrum sp. MC-1LL]NKE77542.1 hypothetical protein [Ochrobactrum sp. MC-1LL]
MKWRCLAWLRRHRPNEAELRLAVAYKEVFERRSEHTEIVLADFAAHTGFYLVDPPGTDLSLYQAGYNAGQRAAFGRLFQFLSLSDEQLRALEEAARAEAEQI